LKWFLRFEPPPVCYGTMIVVQREALWCFSACNRGNSL